MKSSERTDRRGAPQVIQFGEYVLLERVAVGGMAEVYLAKKIVGREVGDLIALKRILPSLETADGFIEMFVDEAKIAGQLDHPAIVPIYEIGKIANAHYMTMEYVWGKDLLRVIKRALRLGGTLAPAMVAWIGAQVCAALHYAHEKQARDGQPLKIVHRDVSPHNILLSYDGHVRLCDFGIAKATVRRTQTQAGVLKGKIGYMSPELARGRTADRRSDLFALGTCLYESLIGARLFAHENNLVALERVREGRVFPLEQLAPHLPQQLAAIVMRALALEPRDRFQTAEEMQHELLRFLAQKAPQFERVMLANWLRIAFRQEFLREKAHLDALDFYGRREQELIPSRHDSALTRLEILDPDIIGIVLDEETVEEFERAAVQVEASGDGSEIFFRAADGTASSGESDRARALVPGSPIIPLTNPGTHVDEDTSPSQIPDFDDDISNWKTRLTPIAFDENTGEVPILELSPLVGPPPTQDPPRARGEPTAPIATTRSESAQNLPRSDAIRFAIVAGVLLVVCIALVYSLVHESTGRIEVRVTPEAEGTVLLDGRPAGELPFVTDDLASGAHEIVIRAPGFETARRSINLPDGATMIVDVALVRE